MSRKVQQIFNCLGIVFWAIGFLANKGKDEHLTGEEYTQGLILSLICIVPFIGYVAFLVFCVLGIINAVKEQPGIPVLDKIPANFFKSL